MTTINLTTNTITFKLGEITYRMNTETNRYSKVVNGKTTRIGKAEFDAAEREHDMEVSRKMDEAMERKVEEAKTTWVRHPEGTDLEVPAEINEYGCVDCSKCNVQNCVHRNCMRRNPTTVGGLGECPRLKVNIEAEEEIAKKTLDGAMEKLGYYPIDSEWNDIRYSTCDGQSKVMAWNTVEEGMEWVKEQELEAKIAEVEESDTTEEIKEIQKKMKKTRKSKDTAFATIIAVDGTEKHITLTAKQVDFVRHLPDTYFWENGLDSIIWTDCLCDDIQGQFAGKPMTVGAMISTLCEKGLGIRAAERRNGRKCTSFALTEMGKRVAKELGLK